MAGNEPDYISSDARSPARHIEQGMGETGQSRRTPVAASEGLRNLNPFE